MATYEYLISEIQNQTDKLLYSTAGQNKRSVDDSVAEQTARELEIPKIEGEVQMLLEQVTYIMYDVWVYDDECMMYEWDSWWNLWWRPSCIRSCDSITI